MLKKSRIFISSCSTLQCYYASSHTSTASLSPPHVFPSEHTPSHYLRREYAIVSDGRSANPHGGLRWPEMTSAHAVPTPYQIFDQKKGSPYSKRRFYELVKVYHPDKHSIGTHDGLNEDTKLARYRLIIAANDILSNPIKRSAYDTYGAGWNGQPDVLDPRDRHGEYHGWAGPGGPSRNATWEDWEKWYQRDAQGPQEPQFASNGAFVLLIALFVVVGGLGQLSRLDSSSVRFFDQRNSLHDRMSRDLRHRKQETRYTLGSREERIHRFLRQREDVEDLRGVTHLKLLEHPEACDGRGGNGTSMVVDQSSGNPPKP